MLQEGGRSESSGRARPPRRSLAGGLAIGLAIVLIVATTLYIDHEAKLYYTISPGTAPVVSADPSCPATGSRALELPDGKPCVRLLVPPGKATPVDGSVMMVDVLVGPTTFWEYVAKQVHLLNFFEQGAVLEPASSILGSTPASQLSCQGTEDMDDATSQAAVVALRRLGYPVTENDLGAQIDTVVQGTPASQAGVECNDLVTAVDGRPVHTDVDFGNDIRSLKPGDLARLTIRRAGSGGHQITVTVSARLSGTPAEDGYAADPTQAFLGVESETRMTFSYPYDVTIDVGDIGGPSAGLALTLGLINALSNGQLTGGHRIAATGTIDLQGDVGAIGDAAQKAVAVRKAGAQVFFVPVDNYAAAKSDAGSMKVVAVSSLQQVLQDLQAMGGHIPAPVLAGTGPS
jgi:PDZ domain-containing protein